MCEAWNMERDDENIIQGLLGFELQLQINYSGKITHPLEFCPWCGAELPDDEHE